MAALLVDTMQEEQSQVDERIEALRANEGMMLTYPVTGEEYEQAQQTIRAYQDSKKASRQKSLDEVHFIVALWRGDANVKVNPLDGRSFFGFNTPVLGSVQGLTITGQAVARCTLWGIPQGYVLIIGEGSIILSPTGDEGDWETFSRELNARNERLKIMPAVRVCPECSAPFITHDPRKIYHPKKCAVTVARRRFEEKRGRNTIPENSS